MLTRWLRLAFVTLVWLTVGLLGQSQESEGVPIPQDENPASQVSVPRVIRVSGLVPAAAREVKHGSAGSPLEGQTVGVTFALYVDRDGGAPLWMEVQNVRMDAQGRYVVLLGASSVEGVPLEFFSSNEARWLGVQVEGQPEQPRVLLVSVPYALKAAEAERLAGRPASDYLTGDAWKEQVKSEVKAQAEEQVAIAAEGEPRALTASGTVGRIAKFVGTEDLGDSVLFESGGNIGLGTTNPQGALHLSRSGGAPLVWQNPTGSGNVWLESRSSNGLAFSSFGNNLRVGNSLFEVINGSPVNGTNVLTIMNTGNIGVGTTNPQGPLHLARGGGAPLIWQNPTGNGNVWIESRSSNGLAFSSFGNNLRVSNSLFEVINGSPVGGTTVLTVMNTGRTGIGTTAPTQALDVRGNIQVGNASFTGNPAGNYVNVGDATCGSSHPCVYFGEIGADDRMELGAARFTFLTFTPDAGGNVGIGDDALDFKLEVFGDAAKTGGGSWQTLSDIRAKADVQPMTGALATLLKLRPVSFHYNEDARRRYGASDRPVFNYIAQEYQQVFPDFVTVSKRDGFLIIDPSPTTPLAVAAIQELHKLMLEKDATIASQERRIEKLESMIGDMEQRLVGLAGSHK